LPVSTQTVAARAIAKAGLKSPLLSPFRDGRGLIGSLFSRSMPSIENRGQNRPWNPEILLGTTKQVVGLGFATTTAMAGCSMNHLRAVLDV
jgi:hypothetical protein